MEEEEKASNEPEKDSRRWGHHKREDVGLRESISAWREWSLG